MMQDKGDLTAMRPNSSYEGSVAVLTFSFSRGLLASKADMQSADQR